MDTLDLNIIELLNQNARMSFRNIARELDVSMSTISNRVKRMEDEGIILGYAPIVDSQKLGYDILVIIGVRISKGRLIDVQGRISKHERVVSVYDITGEWDSMIMARFKNRAELNRFIKDVLSMEFIDRTYTHMVLNVVKEENLVMPP